MLSLPSQQEALAEKFGGNPDIEIVEVLGEAKSAKVPGRPVFAEMLKRIEAGEADGIVSWAPDRLARNSIDGGHIIYLLDTGVLRDLKFATYTFENNSQGKFMLGIMFNQSKYYSDALSENVKRGNATKVTMGWRPSPPPIGYLTCPQTRVIIPDPDYFALVRRMFDLLLEGHLPREIVLTARDDWGMRTRKRKLRGGTPLSLSAIYKLFANPFYKGQFVWNGVLHKGSHEPMVTAREFAQVQRILKRDGKAKSQKHRFPFTGMIRCGSCGLMITAETKRNDYNSLYTYYHCTRRGMGPRCREPAATADQMEAQFAAFLSSLSIPAAIEEWVRERLAEDDGEAELRSQRDRTAAETVAEIAIQLQELHRLRVRRMIDDDLYVAEYNRLTEEREQLLERSRSDVELDRFELFESVVSFSKYAADWFLDADPDTQRLIVKTAGSNFSLTGKKLSGEAAKPFQRTPKTEQILQRCALGEDVLTKTARVKHGKAMLEDIEAVAASSSGRTLLETLKTLHSKFGAETDGGGSATRKEVGTA